MVRRRSNIDWYNVFLTAFSHDGAVDGGSDDSPAPAPPQAPVMEPRNEYERRFGPGSAQLDDDDDGPHFRLNRRAPAKAAAVHLGPDVDGPSDSKGVDDFSPMDEQGEHVSPKHRSNSSPKFTGQKKNDGQADVGLGPDLPSASKGVCDFSPMDEDGQEEHVNFEECSKSSPKKKNRGQLPLNKKKSQGHGGKRKSSVNKRRARATDLEESDYGSSLPSGLSERTNQQLHNSSSVDSRKVQDVILLDDKDMEPKEEVNREMFDRLNEPKIYYPSRDDQEAVELTRSDIKYLDPENFLSSPVINFYIKFIKMTRLCNENLRDKFYIFNTYFFGKLEEALDQPRDFPNLRRWWKGVNIFNNAYIILPIHAKEHWSLVIICLPPQERISEPIILHLDSLGMHHSTKILNTVGRYLETEWRFLSVAEPAWPRLVSDIRKETVQVPQQNNGYDCGLFMLYYIEQFIKDAPARFTADKLDMFSSSWFKPEEASGLRLRLRDLLQEEFECAGLDWFCKISVADSRDRAKGIDDAESEAENTSKPIAAAWLARLKRAEERLKRAEQVMGSTPIQDDAVSDSHMKRSQGDEEDTGSSMPFRDAACEISGTKLWITRVYRPALEPGNRFRSSDGSSCDDRKAFIEQFCRKGSSLAPDVAASATAAAEEEVEEDEEEEEEEEEAQDAVDQALGSRRDGRPIRKTKPNPKCFGPQWSQYSRRRRGEQRRK